MTITVPFTVSKVAADLEIAACPVLPFVHFNAVSNQLTEKLRRLDSNIGT